MKNKHVSRLLRTIAALCVVYYVALLLDEPYFEISFQQLMLFVRSFSNVWLLLALLCLWAAHHVARRGGDEHYVFMEDFPRAARVAFVAVGAVGVCVCAVNLSFITRPRLDTGEDDECRYVIVLGGGVRLNGTLPYGVRQKLTTAASYGALHPQAKIIVTGGKLPYQRYSEAEIMAASLASLGVSSDHIFAEDQAQDTIQNLRNSAALIAREEGISTEDALALPVTVITSRFHLRRAQILSGRLGFGNVRGTASKIRPISVVNSYAREIAAYVKLALRIALTGEPSRMEGPPPA